MVGVQAEEIDCNFYKIDKRILRDFHCENGFVIVIPYEDFCCRLSIGNTAVAVQHEYVQYRKICIDEMPSLLVSDGKNLFIKNPDLSYQHEYRMVFLEHLYQPTEKKVDYKKYHLTSSLYEVAKIIPISSLQEVDDYKLIRLSHDIER